MQAPTRAALIFFFFAACTKAPADDSPSADDTDCASPTTWFPDLDQDGFGDDGGALEACAPPQGSVATGGDCDDANAAAYPGAPETCADGVDQSCDAAPDDGCVLVGDVAATAAWLTVVDVDGSAPVAFDLDADGAPDLHLNNEHEDRLHVLWGPLSPGTVSANVVGNTVGEGSAGNATSAADFDGDSVVDFVVAGGGDAYLLPGPLGRQDHDLSAATTVFNVGAGEHLARADVNDDGVADLIVGALRDEAIGAFGVQLGPITAAAVDLDDMDLVFTGEQVNDYAGTVPSSAGDTNGDGAEDLIAGGWHYGFNEEGAGSGRAWLVLGPLSRGAYLLADADTLLRGEASGYAGESVASAGDLNADGYGDVAVGAYAWRSGSSATYEGRAYVVWGPLPGGEVELSSAELIVTGSRDYRCGAALGAGDLDADGQSDLIVSSPTASGLGLVSVFYGPVADGALHPNDADARIQGEGDSFGDELVVLPDLTGDGLLELAVGAPDPSNDRGTVYIFATGHRQ